MKIGAMNNPRNELLSELRWMVELGLDFIDLTLEPPGAAPWRLDVEHLHSALAESRLGIVGHTAFYLPIAHAFEEVRRAAVAELVHCMQIFAQLGARWMNVHPDGNVPMQDQEFIVRRNNESLRELIAAGRHFGVGVMVENLPGNFNGPEQLSQLLEPLPDLGLHLDIGHCNLLVTRNTADDLMRLYGRRLRHVHLHDNRGGNADLHLSLGAGNVDVARHIAALKSTGYDGTITLEVFSEDRHYLAYSRDILKRAWNAA